MSAPVELRPWREEDVKAIAGLRNDVALQALLLARARGSDDEQVREWLRGRTRADDCLFFVVADAPSGECIGYLQIAEIDWIDRRGDLGVCLRADRQGAGLGTSAIALALERARALWGLRKIGLRVRADNARAIRCYERLGFVHCGRRVGDVYIDDDWQDVVLMELFLERPGST